MAIAAAGLPHAAQAAATSTDGCARRQAQELRLQVLDDAGVEPEVIEAAIEEVERIWSTAGLRLIWSIGPRGPVVTDQGTVLVILRRHLSLSPPSDQASGGGRVRRPLGWLHFATDDRPGSMIEVSLEATATLVARGEYLEQPIATLPRFAINPILGRAIGRVIAHELGHWFMGRGHVGTGLMKARFGTHDLTKAGSPQLPDAWKALSADAVDRCAPLVLARLAERP